MTDGSSGFTPAFIAPKTNKPDLSVCRWHLIAHGADACDSPPYFRDDGSRNQAVVLCRKHQEAVAVGVGFVSKPKLTQDIEYRARRVAATRLAQKDETIAHLRSWLQQERQPEKQPKRTKAVEGGFIYFLLSDNLVKIGWASDLDERMKAYSPGARILAVMPGTKADETRMHHKFADLKGNRREWFTYHPRIMEQVEQIVTEHGDPPRDLNEPMVTKRIVGPRLNRPTQRRARSLGK